MHETDETTRAVAALLDLAAIGIEDAVAEIGRGRRRLFHQQDLVAADAEVPLGDEAGLGRRWIETRSAAAGGIEHDEVVAQALHFAKVDSHGSHGSPSAARRSSKTPLNRPLFLPPDAS